MNRRRLIHASLAAALCLGLILVVKWRHLPPVSVPPKPRSYAQLPDLFNRTLESVYRAARDTRFAPAQVRRMAHLYQANRLFPEARACYEVLAHAPEGLSPHDHYALAALDQDENDLAAAQNDLAAVVQMKPRYLPARLALAEVLFKAGQEQPAERQYSAVLAIEPGQAQASWGLARIALQRGDEDSAVARLEELMARHPESTSAAAALAQILQRRGQTARALALTEWSRQKPEPLPPDPWLAADLFPEIYDLQTLGLKFEQFFKTGQVGEAMPFLQRIEELDPASPVPSLLRGWSAAQAHREADAVREYRIALAKGGDPEKIGPYLAQCLLQLGKAADAAALMADYEKKLPDSVPIAIAYAEVALHEGDTRLARRLLEKALEKQPYLAPQNMSLARILWDAGERAAAARCLQRVATMLPADVPSRALLGEFYLGQSDPLSAIAPLEQARDHVAGDTPAQRSLSALLLAAYLRAGAAEAGRGRLEAAIGFDDRAIRIAPAEVEAYAAKANACVQLRQFRRAAEALEGMASIQPDNPTVYLSLGDVLYQDGQKNAASGEWQKALQLAPKNDVVLHAALADRLAGRITDSTFQ